MRCSFEKDCLSSWIDLAVVKRSLRRQPSRERRFSLLSSIVHSGFIDRLSPGSQDSTEHINIQSDFLSVHSVGGRTVNRMDMDMFCIWKGGFLGSVDATFRYRGFFGSFFSCWEAMSIMHRQEQSTPCLFEKGDVWVFLKDHTRPVFLLCTDLRCVLAQSTGLVLCWIPLSCSSSKSNYEYAWSFSSAIRDRWSLTFSWHFWEGNDGFRHAVDGEWDTLCRQRMVRSRFSDRKGLFYILHLPTYQF